MALYLGNSRVKINTGNAVYSMQLFSKSLITNGIKLLTSDGYILQDLNGTYLTAKENN